MNKDILSSPKRYILIVAAVFVLFILGITMEKTWRMTPEEHLTKAIFLERNKQADRSLSHYISATKSSRPQIQMTSYSHLAEIYYYGKRNVPVNLNKAIYYYEKAANLGSPKAQYQLALFYDVGDKIPENRAKAVDLMKKAATILPEAKYALAVWIERGYFGEPNLNEALALYKEAAEAGVQNAIKSLISIYHGGYENFPKDPEREMYWRDRLENKKK